MLIIGLFVGFFIAGLLYQFCWCDLTTTTQHVSCEHVTGNVVINGDSTRIDGARASIDITHRGKKILTWPKGARTPTFIDNAAVTLDYSVPRECRIRWGRDSCLHAHLKADGSLK